MWDIEPSKMTRVLIFKNQENSHFETSVPQSTKQNTLRRGAVRSYTPKTEHIYLALKGMGPYHMEQRIISTLRITLKLIIICLKQLNMNTLDTRKIMTHTITITSSF